MSLSSLSDDDPRLLARSSALEVRLVDTAPEIEAAQALRFEVFYREMGAIASPEMAAAGRDFDKYDDICDHMLVFDRAERDAKGNPRVVGGYRLLRRAVAEKHGGFYSAGEYDIAPMLAKAGPGAKYLELGRSAILKPYRTGPTMTLLWRGLMTYLIRNEIEVMFGCASLPGTDPQALALPLSYLHHFYLAPPELRVRARPELYVDMNLMPKDAIDEAEGERSLPPLVKGYVRAGAYIGEGAVIDCQFATTDVFIMFPTSRIDPRYMAFFKKKAGG